MSTSQFRGRDFLSVARYLAASSANGEATQRSIIGRSYYACFLEGREYLVGKGIVPVGNPHAIVVDHLRHLDWKLARDLKRLRTLRNEADYEIDLTPTESA